MLVHTVFLSSLWITFGYSQPECSLECPDYTINSINACFGFPGSDWFQPTQVTVNLTCPENEQVTVEEITLLRPYRRNDQQHCRAKGTYDEYKCCEIWAGKNFRERYDNCQVPLDAIKKNEFYRHLNVCANSTNCALLIEPAALDDYCAFDCNTNTISPNTWCWSRRVEVKYSCMEQTSNEDEVTVTSTGVGTRGDIPGVNGSTDGVSGGSRQVTDGKDLTFNTLAGGVYV